jgi:hypothetical protein
MTNSSVAICMKLEVDDAVCSATLLEAIQARKNNREM